MNKKKCKLIASWLLIFIFFCSFVQAQVTGYLGRKFIVKTNVVNGRLLGINSCDVEYVVKRRLSLNAGVQFFIYGRNSKGVRVRTGILKPGSGPNQFKEFSILKNGITKGWIGSVGFKLYFDKIVPSPYGWYMEFDFGFGQAKFENYDVSYDYKIVRNNTIIVPKKSVSGLSGSAMIIYFEAPGFGYQKIFNNFISLDGKISMQGQYGTLSDELLNNFEHNYFLRGNTVSYAYGRLLLCPAVYLKLGILIF
ncbi:MAG: hypothetical protein V4635_04830 [Bacteroidota bacterium]